jgi:hypothetical protein
MASVERVSEACMKRSGPRRAFRVPLIFTKCADAKYKALVLPSQRAKWIYTTGRTLAEAWGNLQRGVRQGDDRPIRGQYQLKNFEEALGQ